MESGQFQSRHITSLHPHHYNHYSHQRHLQSTINRQLGFGFPFFTSLFRYLNSSSSKVSNFIATPTITRIKLWLTLISFLLLVVMAEIARADQTNTAMFSSNNHNPNKIIDKMRDNNRSFRITDSNRRRVQDSSKQNDPRLVHTGKSKQQETQEEEEDDRTFCTMENFQKCISELWSNSAAATTGNSDKTKLDLAFPVTYRQLEISCQDLKARVRCLDRHSERCFTLEMLQVFGHIVTNAKQFVHDLCYNKKIQSEFMIHAQCFRNMSLDEKKCGQAYTDAVNIPGNGMGPIQGIGPLPHQQHHQAIQQDRQMKEVIMRRSCCALQELVLCKRRHVRELCGESAATFMRDHLPRITNPVLEQHCSAYTYGPGTCDEALYRQRMGQQQLVHQQQQLVHQQQQLQHFANSYDNDDQQKQHSGNNRKLVDYSKKYGNHSLTENSAWKTLNTRWTLWICIVQLFITKHIVSSWW